MGEIRYPESAIFWVGACGTIQVCLWLRIMMHRSLRSTESHDVSNLKNDTDGLNLRITRAHGNYTENGAIFALMILVVDLAGIIPRVVVECSGFIFLSGRFFHARGLEESGGSTIGRMCGAFLTLSSLISLSVQCLISAHYSLCDSVGDEKGNYSIMYMRVMALSVSVILAGLFAGKTIL